MRFKWVSGLMTLTRSMPRASTRRAMASVMSSPLRIMISLGLVGLGMSSLEQRPTMRSKSETISSSPSYMASFQMPLVLWSSSSVMMTSIATSQSFLVM